MQPKRTNTINRTNTTIKDYYSPKGLIRPKISNITKKDNYNQKGPIQPKKNNTSKKDQ